MISKELIQSLKNGSVLVIGDIMLDRYIEVDITRISPEAPIPILNKQNERYILGGAGNVVANLRSYGTTVGLVGLVGDDEASFRIKFLLKNIAARYDLVSVKDNHSTVKMRFTSKQHQVFRFDTDLKINKDEEIIENVKSIINDYDVVLLSDYGKGVVSDKVAKEVIKDAGLAAELFSESVIKDAIKKILFDENKMYHILVETMVVLWE